MTRRLTACVSGRSSGWDRLMQPGLQAPHPPFQAPARSARQDPAAAAGALLAKGAHVRLHLFQPNTALGPVSPTDDPQDSQAAGPRGATQLPAGPASGPPLHPSPAQVAWSGTPGPAEPQREILPEPRAPSCRLASETSRRLCAPMPRPMSTLQRQEAARQRGDSWESGRH